MFVKFGLLLHILLLLITVFGAPSPKSHSETPDTTEGGEKVKPLKNDAEDVTQEATKNVKIAAQQIPRDNSTNVQNGLKTSNKNGPTISRGVSSTPITTSNQSNNHTDEDSSSESNSNGSQEENSDVPNKNSATNKRGSSSQSQVGKGSQDSPTSSNNGSKKGNTRDEDKSEANVSSENESGENGSKTPDENGSSTSEENGSSKNSQAGKGSGTRSSGNRSDLGQTSNSSPSGGSKQQGTTERTQRYPRQVSGQNPKNDAEEVVDLQKTHGSTKTEEARPGELSEGSGLLGKKLDGVDKAFKNGVNVLKSSTLGAGGVLLGGLNTAQKGVSGGIQNLRNFADKQVDTTRKVARESFKNIGDLAKGRIQAAVDTSKDVGTLLQDGVHTARTNIAKRASNVMGFAGKELETAHEGAQETAEHIGGLFSRGFNTAKGVAGESEKLVTRGAGVLQKAVGGITRGFGESPAELWVG